MRRYIALVSAMIFCTSLGVAQNQKIINDFSRTGYMSGIKLSFVLLIDPTIDILFTGPSKDTIKEKVNGRTTFFIMGTADKNIKLNTNFVVVQDEEKITGSITNIKGFEDGDVAKGQKVSGLLHLDKKLNFNRPFTIKGSGGVLDFSLSTDALRMMP